MVTTQNKSNTTKEQIKSSAKQTSDYVQNKAEKIASEAASEARRTIEDAAETSQGYFTDFVQTLTRAIRAGADEFQKSGFTHSGNMVNRVADYAEDMTSDYTQKDGRRMADRVINKAERRPALTFGLIALGGFAGAMLIQSLSRSEDFADDDFDLEMEDDFDADPYVDQADQVSNL